MTVKCFELQAGQAYDSGGNPPICSLTMCIGLISMTVLLRWLKLMGIALRETTCLFDQVCFELGDATDRLSTINKSGILSCIVAIATSRMQYLSSNQETWNIVAARKYTEKALDGLVSRYRIRLLGGALFAIVWGLIC